MTEHIFETLETDAGLGVVVDGTMAITGVTAQREEVVRCRDCVHWRKPNDYERSKCTGAMAFVEPTPEGFCAWGKREEES